MDSACEGFCDAGTRLWLPCTADSDCPGSFCSGSDGLPHGSICGCSCLELGGGPSRPGGLRCDLGVVIAVESNVAGPCGRQCSGGANDLQDCAHASDCPGGACEDDTLVVLGRQCIPITTEMVSGLIVNTNDVVGKELAAEPGARLGIPTLCDELAAGATTGMELVGAVNFLGSNLGDLAIAARFSCQ